MTYVSERKIVDDYGDFITLSGNEHALDIDANDGGVLAQLTFDNDGIEELYATLAEVLDRTDAPTPSSEEVRPMELTDLQAANLAIIDTAIRFDIDVEFRYSKGQESPIEPRTFSPEGRYVDNKGHVLFHGTDHDRDDDSRQFRLDRVKGYVRPL